MTKALTKKDVSIRSFDRAANQLRPVTITPGVSRHAEGSCMVEFGHTKVLCTASVDESVPHFLRNSGKGWVTAEYGMLPRATHSRNSREAARGKQTGRTQEIQRLIGRSLRAVVDLGKLGERQITLDCDVIEADGGTRTAAITGAYVALAQAIDGLLAKGALRTSPLTTQVAAISCGIVAGVPVLDLDYEEDSSAMVDANFIMTSGKNLVEVQMTGEESTFTKEEMLALMDLAEKGTQELAELQRKALAK